MCTFFVGRVTLAPMKEIIFYTIVGAIIAGIAQLFGASLAVTLFTSLLIPPAILIVFRIMR